MFPNLNAEMTRYGVSKKDLAELLNISPKTAHNKLAGRTEFTLSEIMKISRRFSSSSIDYLFSKTI